MDFNTAVAARTLWQEARGEPIEGQRAVAHVIINRRNSKRWGETLSSVCLWRAAFSGWYSPRGKPSVRDPNFAAATSLSDDDALLNALAAILVAAETEPDPTGGATHYYADGTPVPDWAATGTPCGKFGHQLFFKDVP